MQISGKNVKDVQGANVLQTWQLTTSRNASGTIRRWRNASRSPSRTWSRDWRAAFRSWTCRPWIRSTYRKSRCLGGMATQLAGLRASTWFCEIFPWSGPETSKLPNSSKFEFNFSSARYKYNNNITNNNLDKPLQRIKWTQQMNEFVTYWKFLFNYEFRIWHFSVQKVFRN